MPLDVDGRLMRRPERLYYDSLWTQSVELEFEYEGEEEGWVYPVPTLLPFAEVVRIASSHDIPLDLPRDLMKDADVCRAYLEERDLPTGAEDDDPEDPWAALEDAWDNGDLEYVAETYTEYFRDDPSPVMPISFHNWPITLGADEAAEYQAVLDAYAGAAVLFFQGENCYVGLTGTGMDLTWDLCRAFCLCGFHPPVALCADLPRDRKLSPLDEWVLWCCLHSLKSAQESLARWHERTAGLYEAMLREQHNDVIPDSLPLEAVLDYAIEKDNQELLVMVEKPLHYMGRLPAGRLALISL